MSAMSLKEMERNEIMRAMRTYPKLTQAARALKINVSTLYRKRKRLGLDRHTPPPGRFIPPDMFMEGAGI